jgi:nucleotide-binding universal stress UspA family protein
MDTSPIIVAYDPSSADHAPVRFGAAAARATGAPLVVVSVHGGLMTDWRADGEVHEMLGEDAGRELERLRDELGAEPSVEFVNLEANTAPRGIHRAMEEYDAGLAVIGSTERGAVGRLALGSTAERVIHGAPCPVAVIPRSFEASGLKTIGVAFVRSDEGREALRAAAGLARVSGAKLRVLTVLKGDVDSAHPSTTGTRPNQDREDAATAHRLAAEEELAGAEDRLARGLDVETEVMAGSPADVLADVSRHLDLLVIGSRAYGPTRAVLLGGVSRRVIASAACPVLVLPRGVRRPLDRLIADQRIAFG